MRKALYRKYRSRALSEIVGQDHITTTLQNALKKGRISHAYLLTGPRGVGKTSIARILAHEINGLPYSPDPHLDIIEIDAASNRRIDEIRDLRDKVATAPSSAKYKIYIIDEVHMLTKEAFNALLKTLEEPPAHVVFILATTEAHKLPETIISRTQRYSFLPVPVPKVVKHLRSIASKESITIDDAALELIAEHGEGSFRDSISLLDQASSTTENIDKAAVEQLLGRPATEKIAAIIDALATKDVLQCMEQLQLLYDQGFEPAMIAAQLGKLLRQGIVESKPLLPLAVLFPLLRELLTVPSSHAPKHTLELSLLETAHQDALAVQASPVINQSQVKHNPVKTTIPDKISTPVPTAASSAATQQNKPHNKSVSTLKQESTPSAKIDLPATTVTADTPPQQVDPSTQLDTDELWRQVLQAIKAKYNTLYGIARMAKPILQDDTMLLQVRFAFHLKRLNEARNHAILTEALSKARGQNTTIRCELQESSGPKLEAVDGTVGNTPSSDITTISNIFGGAELL